MEYSSTSCSLLFPLLDDMNDPPMQGHYDIQRSLEALSHQEGTNQDSLISTFRPRPMCTPWKPSRDVIGQYAPQNGYHLSASASTSNTNQGGTWQSQPAKNDVSGVRTQPSPTTTLYDFGAQQQEARKTVSSLTSSPQSSRWYTAPGFTNCSTPARPPPYRPHYAAYHTQIMSPAATAPIAAIAAVVTPRNVPQGERNSTPAGKSTPTSSFNHSMIHNPSNNNPGTTTTRSQHGAAVTYSSYLHNYATPSSSTSTLQENGYLGAAPPAPKVNGCLNTPPTDRSRQKTFGTPSRAGSITSATYSSSSSSFAYSTSNSSTNVVPSPTNAYTMLPQNLRNDPHRHAKIKTELCLHYLRGASCPFGDNCNYAHGTHELRFKTLYELEKHGIIDDASTYRVHPCFTHVSTGSW